MVLNRSTCTNCRVYLLFQIALLDEETDDKKPCVLYTAEEIDLIMHEMRQQMATPLSKRRSKRGAIEDFSKTSHAKWRNNVLAYKFDGSHGEPAGIIKNHK